MTREKVLSNIPTPYSPYMEYVPTFGLKFINIPYMEHMGTCTTTAHEFANFAPEHMSNWKEYGA